MIKFWAFIYRLTGWYSPWAKLAEYKQLDFQWDDIEKRLRKKNNDMRLEHHVNLTIGMWQCHNGFTRPFGNRRFYRWKTKMRLILRYLFRNNT